MASLRDVAKLADVSISTVSRVINRMVPVQDATRKRVEEAVRALDYKPNLQAMGLRLRRSHLIGLVVPEIIHHTFASFIQYLEESAVARGYNLIVGNHKDDPSLEESFIDMLVRRNVDGIIFSRVSDESRIMKIIDKNQISVVVIDRAAERESLPSVVLDNYRAGQLAGNHLGSLGHRAVACLTGQQKISLSRERLAGFRDALSRHGVDLPVDAVFEGDFKFESGIAGAQAVLDRHPEITAIWAQNDLMAVGALKYLQSIGRSVPREMSLVGMDDNPLARMITPALTTITQPFEQICEKAVELLLSAKNGNGSVPSKIVTDPDLIIRDSTAAVCKDDSISGNRSPENA